MDRRPSGQGFDEWMGIKNTSDESVADFNLETRPLLDEKIAARAVDFITCNGVAGKTFSPTSVSRTCTRRSFTTRFKGTSGGGVYSDALAELDYRTGQTAPGSSCQSPS